MKNKLTATILCGTISVLILTTFCASTSAQTEPLGGQPAASAKPSVKDLEEQVAYQRAFEAVVWATPAVAIYRFRAGAFKEFEMSDNQVIAYSKPATPLLEALTANNVTPYITAFTDLRNGPVVLEIPAKTDKTVMYGQIVDAWQVTIADVGPSGEDKGAGGKYLLIPPGYKDSIPVGYIPIRTESYRIAFAFRSVPLPGATDADAYAYSKTLKMYPLSEASSPKPTRFVDPTGKRYPTLPFYDMQAFQDIYDIISVEPVRARDKVMMGMLASIGIEPGKPFNPQGKTKAAMERAVVDAYFYLQERDMKMLNGLLYWPDRKWASALTTETTDANGGFQFETADAVQIDRRADIFHLGTYYPQKMPAKPATVYMVAVGDSEGKPLEAGKTYRLTMPKDVPVSQFWSLIIYDTATWAFIYNPIGRAGLSSRELETMKKNSDGSVDIYFGPKAPKGLESNWIPTEGKVPYPMLRLYGAEDAFWNKTFKLPDVVEVR
jgi:hypothetical protein